MSRRISFHFSTLLPAIPSVRHSEELALADRESLGCRFGEPFDPRCLTQLYDVEAILETEEAYTQHNRRLVRSEEFESLERWSGLVIQIANGQHIILINPMHPQNRRNLSIGHEFGHMAHGHPLLTFDNQDVRTRCNDVQEQDALLYATAVMLPYAPLIQLIDQGASICAIAQFYNMSVQAVEYRFKRTGLWSLRRYCTEANSIHQCETHANHAPYKASRVALEL